MGAALKCTCRTMESTVWASPTIISSSSLNSSRISSHPFKACHSTVTRTSWSCSRMQQGIWWFHLNLHLCAKMGEGATLGAFSGVRISQPHLQVSIVTIQSCLTSQTFRSSSFLSTRVSNCLLVSDWVDLVSRWWWWDIWSKTFLKMLVGKESRQTKADAKGKVKFNYYDIWNDMILATSWENI